MKDYRYIGKSVTRIDALEKISGAALYTDDIDFGPNLLYAEIVASTEAHAMIDNIVKHSKYLEFTRSLPGRISLTNLGYI